MRQNVFVFIEQLPRAEAEIIDFISRYNRSYSVQYGRLTVWQLLIIDYRPVNDNAVRGLNGSGKFKNLDAGEFVDEK